MIRYMQNWHSYGFSKLTRRSYTGFFLAKIHQIKDFKKHWTVHDLSIHNKKYQYFWRFRKNNPKIYKLPQLFKEVLNTKN